MLRKRRLGNQKGFTLIEIIAVLLLLGILAAVAVPKYFEMQATTEVQTLRVALNDMNSRAVLQYSQLLMENDGVVSTGTYTGPGLSWPSLDLADATALDDSYRDFVGTWTSVAADVITYTTNYGTPATVTFTYTDPIADGNPATIVTVPAL